MTRDQWTIEHWSEHYDGLSAAERQRADIASRARKREKERNRAENIEKRRDKKYGETDREREKINLLATGLVWDKAKVEASLSQCVELGLNACATMENGRTRHRRALVKIYRHWVAIRELPTYIDQTVQFCAAKGFKATKRTHPMLMMIKTFMPRPGPGAAKSASRDLRALRWALVKGIKPKRLARFLEKYGLDRCAGKYAEHCRQRNQAGASAAARAAALAAKDTYFQLDDAYDTSKRSPESTDLTKDSDLSRPKVTWKSSALRKFQRLKETGVGTFEATLALKQESGKKVSLRIQSIGAK